LFGRASFDEIAASESVPAVAVQASLLDVGIAAADLVALTGLAGSKAAARRLIDQGGAYLNEERLPHRTVTTADLRDGVLLLRSGKKRYLKVVPR
jgi:tyrosyl-tRNA synthetase